MRWADLPSKLRVLPAPDLGAKLGLGARGQQWSSLKSQAWPLHCRVRRLPLQGAGWTRSSSDVSSKPKACLLLGDVSARGTPP